MIKKVLVIIAIFISLGFFYKINDINYEKHKQINENLVNHPENLPKKDFAKASSFWFQNLKADYYWLKTVQYIWANAYHSQYKEYLFQIIDLITDLNPYFESPYVIWMLLLPSYEQRYEFISFEENKVHVDEAEKLWLKWVENFCDMWKVDAISKEDDLLKIWNNDEYKNPCKTYVMPFYLAYVYFFYKNEPLEASKYYKIASACEDAPGWAKTLAAIMQWKWWNREKSFFMFLTMALNDTEKDEVCEYMWTELYNVWVWIFGTWEIKLDWKLLKNINELRDEAFGKEEEDNNILKNTECTNNVNKAVRELNLEYVERANENYYKDKWENAYNADLLYKTWYIDYLPIDFQQYEDYWTIYFYNKNTWNFDYMLGNY